MRSQPTIVTAADVAEYILQARGKTRSTKLQKLVYYSQAWSLVWDEQPLFPDRIEAWIKGPVVPELYKLHEHELDVQTVRGNSNLLTEQQRHTITAVLDYYGARTSEWLSSLTHQEKPWIDAREGLHPDEHGSKEITHQAMAEYYENQPCGGSRGDVDVSTLSLPELLEAEAEVGRCEVVEWDALKRELQNQAREVGS